MKHFTLNGKEYLWVKVPSNVTIDDYWFNDIYPNFLQYYPKGEVMYERIVLPLGNWQIVGLLSQIQNDEIKQSLGMVDGEYLILKQV